MGLSASGRVASLLLALATSVANAAPKVNLREGHWRIDIEMTLPGKGPQGNEPIFREICLDATNLKQLVMPENPFCQGSVTHQDAASIDWKMQCSQGGTDTQSKAHFEFTGEKFAGAILTTAPRFGMEFKTIIRGKYLGACPAGKAAAKPTPQTPGAEAVPEKPLAPLPSYKP